jgi:hypothetical protein
MNEIEPVVTFRTGSAGKREVICLSGAIDAFDPDEPFTKILAYDERTTYRWSFQQFDFVVPSICTWRNPAPPGEGCFAALSENGEVVLLVNPPRQEQILEAGLTHPSARGYGYLNNIRQIGERLYACGFSGQVYRRNAPGDWVHMDQGILQPPDKQGGEYFVQVINGAHEQAIYIAGCEFDPGYPARADFWDGQAWTRLALPASTGRINDIYIESEERVWMCGANGTLILGNARDGFATTNRLGAAQLFLSFTKYRDRYYLASNLGLFQFDGVPGHLFRKVRTSLTPELADANVVQSVDGVLWSMGTKDIARFDGVTWERFPFPDNPPVGATGAGAVP